MASRRVQGHLKQVLSTAVLACFANSATSANLEPPPFNAINRHHVNLMSGTAAPQLVDVSIGGKFGLSHSVTTAGSEFVNYGTTGYGPIGPKDKFFGRVVKAVHHERSINDPVMVMRAMSPDGGQDFTINADCVMDSAGNVTTYNTFTSYSGDPRHVLEYTNDKKGLIWTRPDGTRVIYDSPMQITPGSCFVPKRDSSSGYGISRIEYPNGFTITGGSGYNMPGEVKTNTGFQLTYIYVKRDGTSTDYGVSQTSQPWAPPAQDLTWSSTIPTYVVAINNTVDYCAARPADYFSSINAACPGLTAKWPVATYSWPLGMPRVAYLTDRLTTFTITDATGGITKYIHKPFRSTAQSSYEWYEPRLYQIQSASSDVPDITYDYFTNSVGVDTSQYPIYVSGPAAQLKGSTRNGVDPIGYTIGARYGQGGMSINAAGASDGSFTVKTNFTFGTFEIDMWDKTISFEQQIPNKLMSIRRKTDGVLVEYAYDDRFNVKEIKENGIVVTSASYPLTCDTASRKVCNQPTWTKDGNGNQTDYEYDSNSGQVRRVVMPQDSNGIRPEIRYEYQQKFAYFKRSAGGTIQRADTPIYLLTKESKCLAGKTNADGSCANGASDAVITEYDYGPANEGNNLLLRGVTVTANADGAQQIRRTCYSYDTYGNQIGQTKPQAGLNSCY